jgi:methyl-accepting chemotaxis protein
MSLGGSMAVAAALPVQADDGAFTVEAPVALKAYCAVVEEHLAGILAALRMAAASREARSANWEDIKPLLAVLANGIDTDAAVWFAHPNGVYDTVDSGRSDQNLKNRSYFPDLLAGKDVLGPLVISKSTGHRSVIVAAPVREGDTIVGAVGVSVRARLLSGLLTARAGMPDDLIFYALDPTGKAALHRDPDRMFHFPSDMGDPSLDKAAQDILAADSGAVSYHLLGKTRVVVFTRSTLTGWKFVLGREEG